MSQSASQWAAFTREVAARRRLWTIKDDEGFPAPLVSDGVRAQPFWSSVERVQRIIRTVPAYSAFRPYELTWEEFRDRWIPGLKKDGIQIGVNWTGPRATGYDIDGTEVQTRVEYEITRIQNSSGRATN